MRTSTAEPGTKDAASLKFGTRVRQTSKVWWGWLTDKPPPENGSTLLPSDHGTVEYRQLTVRGEQRPRRYRITHSYHLSWAELRALVAHCEANGLQVSIHGNSWHSTRAAAVVMTAKRPEEERWR